MLSLLWRSQKDKRLFLIVIEAVGIGFVFMYSALFPSMKAQGAMFDELLKNYPQGVFKAMGIESFDISHLAPFLCMEYFSILWPILAIMVAITFGGYSIAGEIEAGTLPMLLSLPMSRAKVFWGKFLTSVTAMIGFALVTTWIIWPMSHMFGDGIAVANIFKVSLASILFGVVVVSIASLFSVFFSEKGKAYFLTGGIVIIMYVINAVSQLKERFDHLKYASLFHYYNPTQALVHNNIDTLFYWVALGTVAICSVAGYIWFSRRNISV